MNIVTILGSTVIAAVFSGVLSYIISRRQENLQYITAERKEWREKMREIACQLHGASYKETLRILTELKTRINAFGNRKISIKYVDDAHIWKVINELEDNKTNTRGLINKQKQLIEYISLLLKDDWERSKAEVKGNAYDILSYLMFFINGIYFIISSYVHNANINITGFNLFGVIFFLIIYIVIYNSLFLPEIPKMFKKILKGNLKAKPEKNINKRLILCRSLCIVGDIILVVIYVFLIYVFFSCIGNMDSNMKINILCLIFIYIFAIGLQYRSQMLKLDREWRYINGVNNIRCEYEQKTL